MADSTIAGLTSGTPTTDDLIVFYDNADSTTKKAAISTLPVGAGDVVGPASATDNAVARFDSTTGKLLQNSAVTIADTTGDITGGKYNTVAISGTSTPTLAVTGTTAVSGTNTGDNTVATALTGTPSITVATVTTTGNIELGHATDTTISRVSAGKTAIEGVNQGTEGILQNSQSTAYTLVLLDAGKHIYHPSADTTARIWTIPVNSSVAFPIGTAITFVNDTSAGTLTISITTDTLVLAGAGTTGSRTLTANGIATAIKVTSTRWIISGTNLT